MKINFVLGVFLFALIACKNKPKENNSTPATIVNPKFKNVDTTKHQIYLTFDDGPTSGSMRLYQYLLKNEVPVTLYLVGKHYNAMPGLHKMLDSLRTKPYIVFANHSFSHAYGDKYLKFYNDIPGVINDYTTAQKTLNITSNIARCAGRNLWRTNALNITDSANGPGTALDSLFNQGYNFTGWDFSWGYDYKKFVNKFDADSTLRRVNKFLNQKLCHTPNHVVILGHDQQYADDTDFKQLTDFIESVKANPKYQFATMETYPNLKNK
jgi:peptidoglycan/xylan/chitin deacetylase (PgdA/CDA1 family)